MENRRWARDKRMRTKRVRQEKGRVEERKRTGKEGRTELN
jgi:hypothetical protein